ncbi:MAG: tyrosine-protein phosphatase [Verrucomicrobiota bacterium]
MSHRVLLAVLAGCLLSFTAFSRTTNVSRARPGNWAVAISRPGLPNCFQLTTNFYRGAQPTAAGMRTLKEMGVKTVVNLRSFHSDRELVSDTGLNRRHLKLEPWHLDDEQAVQFLKLVGDTNNLPIFIHCQRGADRTGTLCALYRIAVCGWPKAEAIEEMREGGFGFSPAWQNLVKYLEEADIDRLRQKAGLAAMAK